MLDSTVVFSELMYHPLEDEGAEWIEFHNQLTVDMDLSEWRIDGGVEFEFPEGTILEGGDYLVVASDPSAVQAAHGIDHVLGPFEGRIANDGEELLLINNDGRRMNSLDFADGGIWPVEPDGGGVSLTKFNRLGASEDVDNWSYSDQLGGTPGTANRAGSSELQFNEVASALADTFFVELQNDSDSTIDLAGYVLRHAGENEHEILLPATSLTPGEQFVIGSDLLSEAPLDGDRLFLYSPNKSNLLDARAVTNSLRGRSESYDQQWLWPAAETPGSTNQFLFHDQVVINEIMYHAPAQLRTESQPFAESPEEWIELFNRGETEVDLSGWRLRDAIEFDIPEGTVLGPNQFLVIANDAAALRDKYDIPNVIGDFEGSLSNNDDHIRLSDANKNPVDEVHYYERGNWPETADGGGASLELQDADANNAKAEAWAASDTADRNEWTEYSYTARASEPLNCCSDFNEWIFGLLDSGEFLLDDVSVIRSGTDTELIQNGAFESDALGSEPDTWRFVGNHSGTVINDPDDASNRVVHVVSSGPQQIVSDYVSTTFVNNTAIRASSTYTIRFRAKWLSGSRQLNNRFYLTRASNTALLEAPERVGTPGTVNSTAVSNLGPTYENFGHQPIQPTSSQDVTVTVDADDEDGIASMQLWYRVGTASWRNAPMSRNDDGAFEGTIPNQSSNRIVQFYIEGTDNEGATSTYPRRGRDSRALYQVARDSNRTIETLRFIVADGDQSTLRPTTTGNDARNMSNRYVGATLVRNGTEVFYDVEARQIGSRWIRPNSGYKIRLHPDQKYNGVHDSLRFDINGISEIMFKQMVNRAGGSSVSLYDDIAHMVSPFESRTMLLGLARYENVFLEEQFEDGSDGTKWELDDITYPINASPAPEGTKQGSGSAAAQPQDMRDRGDDPEAYRGQLLIKNNRSEDDYASIVEFVDAINQRETAALQSATEAVMDVDLWMRHYATQSFLGNWDTYGFRRPKNLRIYTRPSDGKVVPLFWDADLANLNEPLIYNGGDSRLDEIRNIPANSRLFWGHMLDLVDRAFNADYAAYWTNHYNQLGAGTSGLLSSIRNRANQATQQAESAIPIVPFLITTPATTIDDSVATLQGTGWINVRQIRINGSPAPLQVTWTDTDRWEITVPVALGDNLVELAAYDFRGELISSDSVTITSTANERPLRERIRISELNFNPAGSDDTEFVELVNIEPSGGQTFDLTGVRFTDGIQFDFTQATIKSLAPGERLLIVKNQAAFEAFYGTELPVAGTFEGSLANDGESIELLDADDLTIHRFTYQDDWESLADGEGYTLNVIDPVQGIELWDLREGWKLSQLPGGTPGTEDSGPSPDSIVINEISNNDQSVGGNWIELLNTTDQSIDIGGWYLSDDPTIPQKFQFIENTVLAAGAHLVVAEEIDFGAAANATPFQLHAAGGELLLQSATQDVLTGYQQQQSYSAVATNRTQGRVPTSRGDVFSLLTSATRGDSNAAPQFGPLVINEIQYHDDGTGPDFIELVNLSDETIELDGQNERWMFTRGIQFELPAEATIQPNSYALVIEVSSSAETIQETTVFRLLHEIPTAIPIFGYNAEQHGVLDNGGESLAIGRFDSSVGAAVETDRVRYDDELPWPLATDGTGSTLSKQTRDLFGNEPLHWRTGNVGGTPGRENAFLDTTPPTAPTDIRGSVLSDREIALAWAPSEDAETDIERYRIYQDGNFVGSTPIPWFRLPVDFSDNANLIYTVSAVNRDGAEGSRSDPLSIGTQRASFQQGADGYVSAIDAEIREGDADANNGTTDNSLEVDGEDQGTELSVLLKWGDLSIPAGSQIVSASMTVNVTNTGHTYSVSRLRRDWDESEATWNHATSDTRWQVGGAQSNNDRGPVVGDFASSTVTFNEAGLLMVQDWINEPMSNHGVIIHDSGGATDGVDFDSREVSTVANRPRLDLLYLPAPVVPFPGDFTLDNQVDADDIHILCQAIQFSSTDPIFDLDGRGDSVSQSDMDVLIRSILGSEYGDANLDGTFDTTDLVQVFSIGEFEDGLRGNSIWTDGDWNCDGEFDTGDLVVAFAAGGFSSEATPAPASPAFSSIRPNTKNGTHEQPSSRGGVFSETVARLAVSAQDALDDIMKARDDDDKTRAATDYVFAETISPQSAPRRLE